MSQVEYDVPEDEEEDTEKFVAIEDDPNKVEDVEGDETDEEEGEETRLGGGREEDEDADGDAKRTRRKEENKSRRVRQREARDRNERELGFLRNRNEQLERRFSQLEQDVDARVTGSELAGVDSQINKARSDLVLAGQVIEQAIDNNNGRDVTQALNHRDTIRDNLRDLESAKEYLAQERPAAPAQNLDPRHVAHAQAFMRDNDWWDPAGRDAESQSVLSIDRSLVQEGYDPTSKNYWDELRTRVEDQFPDRYDSRGGNDDDDADDESGNGRQQKRKSKKGEGPEFRTGGRERPLKKNEVYISPERREAMEEAGVWDDPVLRNKYLASYATYDRDQAAGA